MEDENSRIDESSKKMSDGMGFGKIEKVSDAVTKPVKTWMIPSVTGSKTVSVANKRTVLRVQQKGIHGPFYGTVKSTNRNVGRWDHYEKWGTMGLRGSTHLKVMVCGKYGSLIPIQDKIDLTNAHEKNEDIPEETAVKIEKDNCDNDSGDKIEEFLETSSEVKVEESEADLVMVSLTPHDDLKTEEILNEAKIEEFNPIGIATISSNYI